jgi:hypothetical protein
VTQLRSNLHGESSIYRGKSHLLIAKVVSGRIQTETEPNPQKLEAELTGMELGS